MTENAQPVEGQLREHICLLAKSLFDRGFSVGSAGNISVAVADGVLITPTNSSLGFLRPEEISKVDRTWVHVAGDPPSKELPLHRALYQSRVGTGAVVHLHSTYATAISCLADTPSDDCIPPVTPYAVMRVGKVALLPYVRPGDPAAAALISSLNGKYTAVLLSNHGPVVCGRDLTSAVRAAEELEETAKLVVTLRGLPVRHLTPGQVEELNRAFSLEQA